MQVQKEQTEQARLACECEKLQQSASPSEPVSSQLNNLDLVPKFCEDDVTTFFHKFEQTAYQFSWPKSSRTAVICPHLVGKAGFACASLTGDQCNDYEVVKQAVLNAYQLNPEAYQLEFRAKSKRPGQTYVKYFRKKGELCT